MKFKPDWWAGFWGGALMLVAYWAFELADYLASHIDITWIP